MNNDQTSTNKCTPNEVTESKIFFSNSINFISQNVRRLRGK